MYLSCKDGTVLDSLSNFDFGIASLANARPQPEAFSR